MANPSRFSGQHEKSCTVGTNDLTKTRQEETHAGLHSPLTCEAWLTTEQTEESFSWRESFLPAIWRKATAEGPGCSLEQR